MQCILYHDEAGRLEPSLSSYHVFSWSNIITTFSKRNLPSKNCTQIKQHQIQNIFRPAVLIKIKESTKCLINVVFVSLIWRKYNFLKYDSSRYRWLTSPLHIEAAVKGIGGRGVWVGWSRLEIWFCWYLF